MKRGIGPIVLVVIWEVVYRIWDIKSAIVPPPSAILKGIYSELFFGNLGVDVLSSLRRVLIGFAIATIFGSAMAVLLGSVKKLRNFFLPIIELLRPIPPIAWIPIAILLFGLRNMSSYFIVFIGAFFPVFMNTFVAAKNIPEKYRCIAKSYGLNKRTYLLGIIVPYLLPSFFTGIKVGIGMAWMSVIAAELIGAQSGLGYYIQLNRLLLRSDLVIGGMVTIGVIGSALSTVISTMEKRIIRWKY